jgi:hypothetical protein
MEFTLEVGVQEKHKIDYYRHWFLGTERLQADGQLIANRSAISPSNYVSFPLCRRYEFTIGQTEKHVIILEKTRPLLLAGFRPHLYRVLVDGQQVFEKRGF